MLETVLPVVVSAHPLSHPAHPAAVQGPEGLCLCGKEGRRGLKCPSSGFALRSLLRAFPLAHPAHHLKGRWPWEDYGASARAGRAVHGHLHVPQVTQEKDDVAFDEQP